MPLHAFARCRLLGGVFAALVVAGCGGSASVYTGPIGDEVPGLTGPERVTFEAFDQSVSPEIQPLELASGIVATSDASLYVAGEPASWGLGPCVARPTSGSNVLGVNGIGAVLHIAFDPPVARVDLQVAAQEDSVVTIEALDVNGQALETVEQGVGPCPVAPQRLLLAPPQQEDIIHAVRVIGSFLAVDDLRTWRDATP
ncbi:MAG: hypothetical protein H6806_07120 [Planctomycetes bacterium]|nr:hypothetical protein [Planctomycetota bacterium]MCB9825456.1 hypothetical protein [Planctomycetota bacterium]MCB9829515.1 hypothetical protein [Planctomycetota bacterium]MCB9900550.1 hypothetical protein [Planctomycetota bacterium]